jgi:hypothetical protein
MADPTTPEFTTGKQKLVKSSDGTLAIQRTQYIDPGYLKDLREEYDNSSNAPAGNFHRCASVPVEIADKWRREGFDVFFEPAANIIAKLRKEQMDYFITTKKIG